MTFWTLVYLKLCSIYHWLLRTGSVSWAPPLTLLGSSPRSHIAPNRYRAFFPLTIIVSRLPHSQWFPLGGCTRALTYGLTDPGRPSPKANDAFPPISDFTPYFRKFYRDYEKVLSLSTKISDDLFLVIYSKVLTSPFFSICLIHTVPPYFP